jgi:predicted nuclease with TOPRIM domain
MNDVVGSVRQVIQDFLAPELRQHRAELVSLRGELAAKIEAVESKIGAVETRLESKIDAVASRLDSKIDAVESRFDRKINVLENKINVLDSRIVSGFSALAKTGVLSIFVLSSLLWELGGH